MLGTEFNPQYCKNKQQQQKTIRDITTNNTEIQKIIKDFYE
jgi:hypothetical protein